MTELWEKTENLRAKKKLCAVISMILAILLFALMLFTGDFETNDDYQCYIGMIAGSQACSAIQHPLLTHMVRLLYRGAPHAVNWFYAIQFAALVLSAAALFYVTARTLPANRVWLGWILTAILLWLFAVRTVNFTRTAGIAATAGIMLFVAVVTEDGFRARRLAGALGGCLLWGLGYLLRSQMALVALPFGVMAFGWRLFLPTGRLDDLKDTITSRARWRKTAWLLMPIMLLAGLIISRQLMQSEEERDYRKYNSSRGKVQDYRSRAPEYDVEMFHAIGVSKLEYEALINWSDLDTGLTVEKIEAVGELMEPADPGEVLQAGLDYLVQDAYGALCGKRFLLALCLFLLLLILDRPKTTILPILFNGVAWTAYVCLLLWMGRCLNRATLPLLLASLYAMLLMRGKKEPDEAVGLRKWISLVLCGCILCGCGFVGYTMMKESLTGWQQALRGELAAPSEVNPVEQDQGIYIFHVTEPNLRFSNYYVLPDNLWTPCDADYYDNVFYTGDWDGAAPYFRERLDALGIDNRYDAMVERDDVYSNYSTFFLHYLTETEGGAVACSVTRELLGVELCQYAVYSRISGEVPDQTETVLAVKASGTEDCPDRMEVSMELPEGTWEHYLLNTTVNGTAYTFRLGEKEGKLWAILCNVPADWEPEGVTTLLGVDEAGNVTALKSLVKE